MARIPFKSCNCEDYPCCEHADNYALTGEDALDICCPHCGEPDCFGGCEESRFDDEPWDDMDGDHESALASAGFGTDEDYMPGMDVDDVLEPYDTPLGMEMDGFYGD